MFVTVMEFLQDIFGGSNLVFKYHFTNGSNVFLTIFSVGPDNVFQGIFLTFSHGALIMVLIVDLKTKNSLQ